MKEQRAMVVECPDCKKLVPLATALSGRDLDEALKADGDVEAVCFYDNQHRFKLSQQGKENLRRKRKLA